MSSFRVKQAISGVTQVKEQLPFTAWNSEENEALQGLPWGCRILYLQGLRRYMDWETRLVGAVRRVSWNGLRDALYVEPHPGETESGKPSKSAVRRMGKRLEKAGLVHIQSEVGEKRLIIFLPLATPQQFSQKKPDTNPTHPLTTQADPHASIVGIAGEASRDGGLRGVNGSKPERTPDTSVASENLAKPTRIHISNNYFGTPPVVPLFNSPKVTKGTRLSQDWSLPPEWEAWACRERQWTPAQAQAVAEGFRDYWISVPGRHGYKLDWLATWRNWVRNQRTHQHAAHQRQDNSAPGRVARAIATRNGSRGAQEPAASSESGDVIDISPGDYHEVPL